MKNRINFSTKRKLTGFMFTFPWLFGFVFFFMIPIIQSIILSVSKLSVDNGIKYTFVGFVNYQYLFQNDPNFIPNLGNTIIYIGTKLFLVIIFSFFIAGILSKKFRGRLFARATFFLPVIIASGIVMSYIKGDVHAQNLLSSGAQSNQFQLTALQNILMNTNLDQNTINFVLGILNSIFEIPWYCGIQILIFMAGFQSISPAIKESAAIEGASGWGFFWKITFPILTPILQLNIIYTIIDGFTDYSNSIIRMIYAYNSKIDYSYASALSWVYFSIIFAIIAVVYLITRKKTFNYTD